MAHYFPGWGFDLSSFDGISPYLKFDDTVAVAHSYGIIPALQSKAAIIIAIGSFKKFDSWPTRVFDEMYKKLELNPEQVLQRFYQQCGLKTAKKYTDANSESLIKKLHQLRQFGYQQSDKKIICIHGNQDNVVSPENAISRPFIIDGAGHCPHMTHVEQCVSLINAAV